VPAPEQMTLKIECVLSVLTVGLGPLGSQFGLHLDGRKSWLTSRLFGWISVRKQVSPQDYEAETSVAAPTQSPQKGQPHEHPTLYFMIFP